MIQGYNFPRDGIGHQIPIGSNIKAPDATSQITFVTPRSTSWLQQTVASRPRNR